MKKFLSVLIILTTLVTTFNGCKKDDDDDSDGPCGGYVCSNGGTCVNGICECPEGYTGPACEDQVTPSVIKITKITVTHFTDTTSSGDPWDPTSGPDIYPRLLKGSFTVWQSPNFTLNAVVVNDYEFIPNPPIEITEPLSEHVLGLYDNDDIDSDDHMKSVTFTPYSDSNRFPTEIILNGENIVSFKLDVTYVW